MECGSIGLICPLQLLLVAHSVAGNGNGPQQALEQQAAGVRHDLLRRLLCLLCCGS